MEIVSYLIETGEMRREADVSAWMLERSVFCLYGFDWVYLKFDYESWKWYSGMLGLRN